MPAKRPLTPAEWIEAVRRSVKAESYLHKLGSGLLVTMPVATFDSWANLRHRVEQLAQWLNDARFDVAGDSIVEFEPEDGFEWFCRTKSAGLAKRPLARSEWALLGEQVKLFRAEVGAISSIVQRAYPIASATRWNTLADRADRLKSSLDAACCHQHRDWPEATRVFYGPLLADCPELAASVDLREVEAIAKMSATEASRRARESPAVRPLKHWSQLLPLRPMDGSAAPV